MSSATGFLRHAAVTLVLAVAVLHGVPAFADNGFPFGLEMTLDVARQPGSKRLPTLEIGDSGEAVLELWCKAGKGQFSVAGNTVVFVAGPLQDRACPPARATSFRLSGEKRCASGSTPTRTCTDNPDGRRRSALGCRQAELWAGQFGGPCSPSTRRLQLSGTARASSAQLRRHAPED